MAIVKAEAYGHGLIPIARELAALGADFLAVSFLEEGVLLRKEGIDTPILVMGGLVDEQIDQYLDYGIQITVSSVWKAKQVEEAAAAKRVKAEIQLKVDTGMGRIGQNWQTADVFFKEVVRLKHLDVRGIYTHLATADEQETGFTHIQLDRFRSINEIASKLGLDPPLLHTAGSGAIMQLPDESRFTLIRPGLMLYGWAPAAHLEGRLALKPVMTLRTSVVYVKRPPAGTTIGYGATWSSPGERWIATLPIGYGDGYPRKAGNRASVILRRRLCPVVGRVSMDQITVDAGHEAYLGDEAVIFGGSGKNRISLWDFCKTIDAIPYEILCGLTSRVPRLYY